MHVSASWHRHPNKRPARSRTWLAVACFSLMIAGCSESAPQAQLSDKDAVVEKAISTIIEKNTYEPNSVYGSYLAGLHARAQNDSRSAALFMENVLASDPKNIGVLQAAFVLNVQNGDIARALPLAKRLQEHLATDQLSGLTLAAEGFRKGDYAGAKRAIEAVDGQGLGGLLKPLLTAWAETGLGNADAALASLTPLSESSPFQPFFAYHSALITSLEKRHDLAEQHFAALLANTESRSLRAGLAYGQYLETRDKHAEAAEVYRNFISPLQPHPLLSEAIARNEAEAATELAVKDPAQGAAEVFYGISSILSQDDQGNPMAIVYVQLANYVSPDFYEARMLLAGLMENSHRYGEAIKIYAALPKSSPLYEAAQIQIAVNQERAGLAAEAVKTLQTYVAENKEASLALLTLADMLRNQERFEDAIPVYDRLIASKGEIQHQHWPLLYARGICYERAGNWPLAERDLQKALELQPDQPHVLNYLAYSWIDKGLHLPRAKEMIESAARQRPDDGAIIDSLGWMHYRVGDFHSAVETLENAVTLLPQDAVINDHLGDAYWQVGRKLEAQFQWQRALTLDPEPEAKRLLEQKLQSGLSDPPVAPAITRAQKS